MPSAPRPDLRARLTAAVASGKDIDTAMAREYNWGATLRELAAATGYAYGTVRNRIARVYADPRPPGVRPATTPPNPDPDLELGARLSAATTTIGINAALGREYRRGATIRELMAATGFSYGTVHDRLSKAKVTLRRRGTRYGTRRKSPPLL